MRQAIAAKQCSLYRAVASARTVLESLAVFILPPPTGDEWETHDQGLDKISQDSSLIVSSSQDSGFDFDEGSYVVQQFVALHPVVLTFSDAQWELLYAEYSYQSGGCRALLASLIVVVLSCYPFAITATSRWWLCCCLGVSASVFSSLLVCLPARWRTRCAAFLLAGLQLCIALVAVVSQYTLEGVILSTTPGQLVWFRLLSDTGLLARTISAVLLMLPLRCHIPLQAFITVLHFSITTKPVCRTWLSAPNGERHLLHLWRVARLVTTASAGLNVKLVDEALLDQLATEPQAACAGALVLLQLAAGFATSTTVVYAVEYWRRSMFLHIYHGQVLPWEVTSTMRQTLEAWLTRTTAVFGCVVLLICIWESAVLAVILLE